MQSALKKCLNDQQAKRIVTEDRVQDRDPPPCDDYPADSVNSEAPPQSWPKKAKLQSDIRQVLQSHFPCK